jgi:hypothetical protein
VAGWLGRYFSAPGHALELRAIFKDRSVRSGFFDEAHLGEMAEHGLELSQSAGVKGVYFTLNPLRPEVLSRPGFTNQVRKAGTGDSARAADVARRRLLLIDADPRRPANCSATDQEKDKAKAKVLAVRDFLTGMGWPSPLLCDSGNGYHLLYRIDLPADDGGLVKRVLHALDGRFDDAAVEIDRKVHDAPRITKLYGTRACKGEHTPERPHRGTGILEAPETLQAVPQPLLEKLAGEVPVPERPAPQSLYHSVGHISSVILDMGSGQKQQRARAYLAKMNPAIEGRGGDRQTFTAACSLVIDFDLTPEEALPLLREYNERCVPPWSEDQLVYKLQKALEKAGEKPEERGRLLQAGRGRPSHSPTPAAAAADPYLGTVPNFILADYWKVWPRPRRRDEQGKLKRGPRPLHLGLCWLLHREIIRQKRATVCLPDVLLAQAVWGDRRSWPANWRQQVAALLARVVRQVNGEPVNPNVKLTSSDPCPPECPLHGAAGVRHRHFRVTVLKFCEKESYNKEVADLDKSSLGVLELYGTEQGGERTFDFARPPWDVKDAKARKDEIDRYKKWGRIWSVYLPALLFGPCPRSGLSHEQRNILTALTRETTRTKHSPRDDKAMIVKGGEPDSKTARFAVCPFLQPGVRYVAFNGNGSNKRRHLRGRGYQLVGKTKKGWRWRAGFRVPEDAKGKWKTVRSFLTELHKLSGPFGLTVAAWHPAKRQWHCLSELIDLTRTPAGQAWLNGCQLRVYTEEDYLVRWRRYFADRLGFSVIPDGDEAEPVTPPTADRVTIESAEDLDLWMRRAGLTDQQLSQRLGVSRSYVSRQRSGHKPWSKQFQAHVAAEINADKFAQATETRAAEVPKLTLIPSEGTKNSH